MSDPNSELTVKRYPETSNRSLQAWNAGDDYLLSKMDELSPAGKSITICNDRFGYLSCHLNAYRPQILTDRKSQKESIRMNLKRNSLSADSDSFFTPLSELPEPVDVGIVQVPKSLDLFRFYLHQISSSLSEDGIVFCAFMTKYFTPQLLEIADEYFEDVDQSLAVRKSRVLTLRGKKELPETALIRTISYSFDEDTTEELKQYPGVFSADHIDYATQFLIESVTLQEDENIVLDMGSGNGVIARSVQLKKPDATLHLIDDFYLAVESSKLNLKHDNAHFHWSDSLSPIENVDFDLVLSNPPFHFEHETNIEVTVDLFREVAGILKPGGRFLCVANQHLGYLSHLKKFFTSAEPMAQNKKYVIYECKK